MRRHAPLGVIVAFDTHTTELDMTSTARQRAGHYIGDFVYGANDGIITTFAVVAGVAGASLSPRVIIILGASNLFADGFSMAASSVLATRSEEAVERLEDADAPQGQALRHGLATFVAFLLAGAVPLLAYVVPGAPEGRFRAATILTLITLFAVGAARTAVTRGHWLRNGLEMLTVGALAAAVAYGVGRFLGSVTG